MATTHLTKGEFVKRVSEFNGQKFRFHGERPALIDFYAEWCSPCRMLAPILEELSDEYAGKMDIYKINVDEERELASTFAIRSIPTLIFVDKSGILKRTQGAMGKQQLKETIESTLFHRS
jgi:thioredoxin